MNDYSNRLANVFHSHGYKHGDVVGLLQENRPEFVATWLGLSKLGVIVPLINHNLRKNALMHSVTVANCNALIYGEALADAVAEIADQLPSAVALYQVNEATQQPVLANAKDLTTLMQSASKELPVNGVKKPNHHDKLIYIYTSGTTGLPKAAVITHSRLVWRWRVVQDTGLRGCTTSYTHQFHLQVHFYCGCNLPGGWIPCGRYVLHPVAAVPHRRWYDEHRAGPAVRRNGGHEEEVFRVAVLCRLSEVQLHGKLELNATTF